MPGITGIIGAGQWEARQRVLQQMVSCMQHEPFYVSGMKSDQSQDVHAGWVLHKGAFADCNPSWNEARDICLIFTGETFADPDDLSVLRRRGHRFDPDTASSLVHLYEEMGLSFLERLNGTFSGLILDLREEKVILFNDRHGLGRVYFHQCAVAFYFGSEAKSLLRVLPALREVDAVGLAEFGACGCALENRTLFSGISLLPPASAWIFRAGRLDQKVTYFDESSLESQECLSPALFRDRLTETFQKVLPRYFQGHAKVGVSLTGGLDGRMIMACADRPVDSLPCYTFGGTYRDCTDVTYARRVAKCCGQPHQVLPVDDAFLKQFPAMAQKAVYISDGAMDVTGSVELFANQMARDVAPVRLTGNYGSEILRHNIAFKPQALSPLLFNPEYIQLGREAAATFDRVAEGRRLSFIAFKQVPWHHHARLSVEQSQVTMRSPYLDNDLVALAYQTPENELFSALPALQVIHSGRPALGRIATDRGLVHQPTPILSKLEHLYQEFTFRAEYAYDYGMPQWLASLDQMLSPLRLERMFLGRHKFYHFRVWYRDQLGDYLKEILLDPRTKSRPIFEKAGLEQMVATHLSGKRNYTSELHQALSIELIHRHLIDES